MEKVENELVGIIIKWLQKNQNGLSIWANLKNGEIISIDISIDNSEEKENTDLLN